MNRREGPGASRSDYQAADPRGRPTRVIEGKATVAVQPVTLIPDSAIQFLDFMLSHTAVAGTLERFFEDSVGGEAALYCAELDGDILYHPLTGQPAAVSQTFAVSGEQALAPYLDHWLPLPILRVGAPGSGAEMAEGPTNWARVYISADPPIAGADPTYRIVLALDTACDPRPIDDSRGYVAPTVEDAKAGAAFRFVSEEATVAGFVSEAWVDDWLRDAFREFRQRSGEAAVPPPGRPALDYLARYLTLLKVLEAARFPEIRLAPPQAEKGTVGVDLVLDIGHTRTLALIRQSQAPTPSGQVAASPRNARLLPVRDLSEPWRVHEGYFASRIEFAPPSFGKEALSRLSDRSNAFYWPSLARIGAEAERLAALRPTTDDMTGLTSPMRYLWDEQPAAAAWRFAKAAHGSAAQRGGLVAGPQLLALPDDVPAPDEAGDKPAVAPVQPRFSRAALLSFLVAEVLAHAQVAINAPGSRGRGPRSTIPRRIERILVTVPPGLVEAERASLRKRISDAVRLVWHVPAWSGAGQPPPRRALPDIRLVHDNASNVTLAYLYNEIAGKFRGRAHDYFELAGRQRPEVRAGRSLRVATIDIGGGTSGISIATFHAADTGPAQGAIDVCDGVRIGGDDIAKAVVERHVLPALVRALDACKLPEPRDFLSEILGGRAKGRPAWLGGFGRRFARDFAYPLAIALTRAHVEAGDMPGDVATRHTIGTLLTRAAVASRTVADELDDLAAEEGAIGFSCQAVAVSFLADDFNATIMGVLGPFLANAVHLIEAFDCDTVLISGAASRIPAVLDALIEAMPARAGRIVQLADYAVADWYPLRTTSGRVADPKSLAAVGALVAVDDMGSGTAVRLTPALATGPLMVGRLDGDGLLRNADVLFTLGLPREERLQGERTQTFAAQVPCLLGARRMPLESWPPVPYAVIDLEAQLLNAVAKGRVRQPLRVTIERVIDTDSDRENLILVKALDAEGATLSARDVTLRFQTQAASKGYWLDSGALTLGG